MTDSYEAILQRSATKHAEIMKKMKHLSRLNKVGFDAIVHRYHDEVFGSIDCTKCGLCCKSISPIFRNTDIKHICATIGMPQRELMDRYLQQDPDGVGFMLRDGPCPFQNPDNTCSIYDVRTLSCSNFPHTRSKNIQRKLVGLALDSLYCPAAFLICEKIIQNYP